MISETTKELREQAEDLLRMAREGEKREEALNCAREAAMHISTLKSALMEEGFSREEAYDLMRLIIEKGVRGNG